MESTTPEGDRRTRGSTFLDFALLFRAVGIALWPPTRLVMALAGVIATGLLGLALDAVSPASSSPAIVHVNHRWVSEAGLYNQKADAHAVRLAVSDLVAAGGERQTSGVFKQFLFQLRTTEDRCIAGVFGLDPREIIGVGRDLLVLVSWLVAMHSVYAIFFGLGVIAIWGFFGIGISRGVAVAIARNDEPSVAEYADMCKSQWTQAATLPLIPAVVILAAAIALWIFGLIGAIPFAGKLIVGVLFPIVIFGGAVMALSLVLGAAAIPMAPSGIAASGDDAMDALGKAASFVFSRPVKTLFYYFVAFVVGVIAFAALKWLIALSLWCGGSALRMTMDVGGASVAHPTSAPASTAAPGALDALWIPPSPSGATPFYGTFPGFELEGASWASRGLIRLWLVFTWACLAAFAASYFYASAGIAWFLLRRDVDRTDITEVDDENADKDTGAGSAVS